MTPGVWTLRLHPLAAPAELQALATLLLQEVDAGRAIALPGAVGLQALGAGAGQGREVHVTRTDGRTIRGRAVDVDERGGLVIEAEEGRITVRSGEVEHVR